MRTKNHSAFTLVELIVVITILAILGTIGFLSIGGYSTRARDSGRTSDLTQLAKSLDLFTAAGNSLPQQDANLVTVTASGTVIGYQGYAGKNVLRILDLGGKFQDPSDGQYYTYSTNANSSRYQILGLLEDSGNPSLLSFDRLPGVDMAYAAYDTRYPVSKGASLGILLGTGASLNQPLQEVGTASLDVVNTTNTYGVFFSNKDVTSGTGITLFSNISTRNNDVASNKTIASLDPSLIGYWDMESLTGSQLRDLSGKGNNGSIAGAVTIGAARGKLGNATQFTGSGGGVVFVPRNAMLEPTTMSVCFYAAKLGTGNVSWWNPIYKEDWPNRLGYNFILNDLGQATWRTLANPNNYDLTVTTTPSIDQMNFYCGTFSAGTNRLYINGNLVGTASGASISAATAQPLLLGGSAAGYAFNGILDEVRIYNRTLSLGEIQGLYIK